MKKIIFEDPGIEVYNSTVVGHCTTSLTKINRSNRKSKRKYSNALITVML